MNKWILLFALCATGPLTAVYGQTADSVRRQAWATLAQPGSTARWFKVRDDAQLTTRNFFEKTQTALNLNPRDEFRLVRTKTDQLGMSHHTFQQYHKGYRVEDAIYVLHEKEAQVVSANGQLAVDAQAVEPPVLIPATEALAYALELIPTKNFLWLDEKAETALKNRKNDPNASFYPNGELVWLQLDSAQPLRLVWRFDIATADGLSERLYLDAATMGVVRRVPIDINCDGGSGATTWNGTFNFNSSKSGSDFILLNDCQAPNIHVFNGQDSSSTAFSTEYTDADNNWTGQSSAIQTYFGLHQSWQYYLNRHSRDSYDDGGADINGYNQSGFIRANGTRYWSNASWSPSQQIWRFGDDGTDGAATDDWNTIDIVGHEFTHAVTSNEADLTYSGESGALNESFSDIFGEMVELFTENSVDWLVGADRGYIRNMTNPNDKNDPDTYLGANWVSTSGTCDGTNDNCGVHTNSGVQNFWFYLLAVGGSGVNDNGDAYSVQGIGATDAANIAYRSLSMYLTNGSDYSDAKQGAIQAAIDLFGNCSNQVLQCARAWNAVGVNSTDGFGYDIDVDCPSLDFVHLLGLPYHLDVFNDIRSDCNILPNGAAVVFEAGHAVLLKPGFDSGDKFHAFIDPCASPIVAPLVSGESEDRSSGNAGPSLSAGQLSVYPNPFRSSVRVLFHLPENGPVTLNVLDAYGRRVHNWYTGTILDAGEHSLLWQDSKLPNGLYTVELLAGGNYRTQKILKAGD